MASVPKSQYDELQKRHENMRKNREREKRRCSKLEAEILRLRCELKEAQSLLDRIGDALEDVDYKGDYADGVKALLLRSNVELSGPEAALSPEGPARTQG